MLAYPPTLAELFWQRLAADPKLPAVFAWREGKFQGHTWHDLARDAAVRSAALAALGVQPGDRVAHVSENRYEWVVTDLAILLSGAVHVPIHAPLSGAQIAWQIADSGSRVVIVSGAAQAQKLAAVAAAIPKGVVVRTHDRCEAMIGSDRVTPLLTEERNERVADEWIGKLQDCRAEIRPEQLASLLYTSGTTGQPRGVMLSHRNLAFDAWGTLEAFQPYRRDRRLNFLPLSHIFARTCDWYVTIVGGSEMGLARSRETIFDDCRLFQPTVLNGVPYFFDKVRRTLIEQGKADEPGALAQLLGGAIRLCNSGGAPLPDHVFDFYEQRGLALRQGYGLTESSPVITLSTEDKFRRGSVGLPIPGVEVKIDAADEIVTKGPHVMLGYWNNSAETTATVRDGWLATGDLGRIDADGYLFVTGRRKELIVLASGKKVEPNAIETLLTADPLIVQAVVVGEGRNYLTALIVPNPDELRKEIRRHWLWVFSRGQALRHPRVRQWFEERIRARLAGVAPWEQVKKFTLLGRGFTIDSGEMTPKLSLRRPEILRNCQAEIDAMYR